MTKQYTPSEVHQHAELAGIRPTLQNLRRTQNALQIVDRGGITKVRKGAILPGERAFTVPSQSTDSHYDVSIYDVSGRAVCSCPDTHTPCKHIIAVRIFDAREVEAAWADFVIEDTWHIQKQTVSEWLELFA